MNITVIISSHILSEIEQIANRMLIISKGKKLREGGVKELMEADEMNVDVKVDNAEKSLHILKENGYETCLTDSHIRVRCEESGIPAMTKKLVDAGILIFEVKQQRTLEEYFRHVTA